MSNFFHILPYSYNQLKLGIFVIVIFVHCDILLVHSVHKVFNNAADLHLKRWDTT